MMNLKKMMMTWIGRFLRHVIAKILSPHNGRPQHLNLVPARLMRGAQRKSGRPPSCETPPLRSLERAVTVKILSKYHYLMMNTVPFRIVRHGLWPVTTAPKFYFSRGQCDAWFYPIFGELNFRPGMLKLEFSANTLSQPAKANVTRDYHQFRRRQGGLWPVTRRTIRNGTVLSAIYPSQLKEIMY